MKAVQGANLAVRFLVLELGALAIAAYWGYTTGDGVLRWVLAIGAPLLVAAAWGLFVSPKAKADVPRPARFAIELTILGAAARGSRLDRPRTARDRVRRARNSQRRAELRLE